MNFYKLHQYLTEEITPNASDNSGVSEPANDVTFSNILTILKGLVDKVTNPSLQSKINKFIKDIEQDKTSQKPEEGRETASPSDTATPPSGPLPAGQAAPTEAPTPEAGAGQAPAATPPAAPPVLPPPPA